MNMVMNELWGKITDAQTSGSMQINTEHNGSKIQIKLGKTGWYEGYY